MAEEEILSPESDAQSLSWRGILLGVLLSAVLSAANAYLGLMAGMTVSASIPAAVLSMGLLRALGGTIFENNLVQTGASAGESVAAGAIFTLPALILLDYWERFDPLISFLLLASGGLLGVFFTIPLRATLLNARELSFPEGRATALVLQAGHAGSSERRAVRGAPLSQGLGLLVGGAVWGALVKFIQAGCGVM
ncbi:MAG: OPT/YSL family transporter, partial [Polyangiaceae bacterium]|nr:OPT/YSL family transporter [Polyangiaceae bacterium]